MAEYTAVAQQTVEPNQVILFTDVAVRGNNSIIHRQGSGLVSLRGLTNTQCRARFRVSFGANIAIPTAGTVGPISVAIAIDGEAVLTSRAIVTPAAVDEYFNVTSTAIIDVPKGCCDTVSVDCVAAANDGTTPAVAINVQNANLVVSLSIE